ncbi:MAG: fatty acid desaturase, partial [bacterium]|nr:fatty acid desaturase [bacterium]
NNSEIDGDIRINWIVFTREQGMEKSGFDKFMVQHQQWFFIPLLFASAMSMWFASLSYLISPQEARKDSAIEIPLFLIHTICYVALLVLFLDSWWHIILFTLVHKMAQGLYMGSVFATNHKAMPVIDSKNSIGWEFILRQVLTSRNIQVPKFLRILFGGLDRQIEHHLFPWASEIELGSIQKEVKKFCRENNISYTETGFFGSMWDILRHLGGVASQLDKNSKATSRA